MRETLPQILQNRVDAETMRPDAGQVQVAHKLELRRLWLETNAKRRAGLLTNLFARPELPPKGIYLWGGVGRGKSLMMDLFAENTAIMQKRRVHFHAFMQEVHRAMHQARTRGVDDALAPFAAEIIGSLRMLAFDEVQITDIADAMIVGRLFEKLFAGGVMIVATSNRPPDDLYRNGLNRVLFLPFIELLRHNMEVVELVGPSDYRQDRPVGSRVYFHPAGTARPQIDVIWGKLAAASAGAPLTLAVNGRNTVLSRFANGVARANFWELCGRALGPADYLAIAGAVKVLILEDIPLLSSANYNEAKRFVTLIDTLYEAKVRLICSAADEPERLFLEGDGSFEFVRTASRLREMQSEGWGVSGPAVAIDLGR